MAKGSLNLFPITKHENQKFKKKCKIKVQTQFYANNIQKHEMKQIKL